ncbi:MAG: chromosome segregation protein SMC [Cyclobacteriaceae bacterium]|nr:chromosome segregation protein SMC [Cyclobacteriaceae bacterium]
MVEKAKAQKNNKVAIIITLLTIIVVVQGIKIFMDAQEKTVLKEQNDADQKELATTIQRLNDIRAELDEKIIEIQRLGGNIEELEKARTEIEAELKRTNTRDRNTIKRLSGKVEGYEELLLAKDKEIEELKVLNKELFSENTDLKTERNELNRTITELNDSNTELVSKVDIASRLKAENIKILAVSSRGRERESPIRTRYLNQLKVVFSIAENDVAPIEGKEVMIRVKDPQDNIIFDVAKGSGTFMLNGKEEFYTSKQDILFDNSHQELTFLYDKGSEYELGTYLVEVFCEDYKMGSGQFVVK